AAFPSSSHSPPYRRKFPSDRIAKRLEHAFLRALCAPLSVFSVLCFFLRAFIVHLRLLHPKFSLAKYAIPINLVRDRTVNEWRRLLFPAEPHNLAKPSVAMLGGSSFFRSLFSSAVSVSTLRSAPLKANSSNGVPIFLRSIRLCFLPIGGSCLPR